MNFSLASISGGFIALWSILYVVLLLTLGIISIRKGHWVMFLIGLFFPLFWFIGALLPAEALTTLRTRPPAAGLRRFSDDAARVRWRGRTG